MTVRVSLTPEDVYLIEDALTYYRSCTEMDGPDDHSPKEIRKVERKFSHIISRIESQGD